MATPEADAVSVLFIGATGRCGTTLIDRILGQHDDVFAIGELNRLWEFGLREQADCGCGRQLLACPTWWTILEDVYGSVDAAVDAAHRNEERERSLHTKALSRTMGSTWPTFLDEVGELAAQVERIYASIRRVTGARLVVDASKHPLFAAVVRSRPGVDFRLLHIVRDPRAAAFSWKTPKATLADGQGAMWEAGAVRSTASWVLLNREHRLFGERHPDRYLRLRYEDFVADPQRAMSTVGALVDMDFDSLLPPGPRPAATLTPTHSAWGNPNRFAEGAISIEPDERWRTAMSRVDRAAALIVAAPELRHYGYPES